jgi:hypothetical protein
MPDLTAQIETLVEKVLNSELPEMSFEELARTHAELRAMITENNARHKNEDTSIKVCTKAIEGALHERLAVFGAKSVVVPSGAYKVSTEEKIVYNTTDAKSLLHWAVANGKEHLLSVSLVSSSCIKEFETPETPTQTPEFIVRVEIPQTKVTRT